MTSLTIADMTVLSVVILTVTALYSSVGQGGGSGYLAAMALFGVAPEVMKPMALAVGAREHHARYLGTAAIAAHAWCECRERHT